MAYPVWQPGTLYQPGDIVVPITAPSPTATAVENGDFSAGASNWDFTGAAFYSTHVSKGGWRTAVELPGNQPSGGALNQTKLVVPVGKKITATCLIDQGASIAGATRGWVEVHWFSGTDVLLRVDKGNQVDSGAGGAVHPSTCESTCPEGAAYCRAGIELWSVADHNHAVWGGILQVEGTFAGLPADLAYKAVQPESGFSDASEPAWPPVLGQQVVDNEVTWEAIAATRVVWTAEPLYVSGDTEPEWPEEEGGMVKDGTVTLRAVSRRVEDPNCPNTKIVAIAASKVFCGDDDIVRYSATVNPLDWSTDNDAGYLPTGLQNYGSNPVEAMGLYRGNLIVFNAEAFQLWQVDEDPANMALLDALPMGSTQHHAIAPVSNDLFFLASQGVRTVGIAASSTNFQAGDVGMPVDPLVQEAIADGGDPLALYYPAMGQYWLAFGAPMPIPPGPVTRRRFLMALYGDNSPTALSEVASLFENGDPDSDFVIRIDGVPVSGDESITGAGVMKIAQFDDGSFALFGHFLKLKKIDLPGGGVDWEQLWAATAMRVTYDGNVTRRNDAGAFLSSYNSTGLVHKGNLYVGMSFSTSDSAGNEVGTYLYRYDASFQRTGRVKLSDATETVYFTEKTLAKNGICVVAVGASWGVSRYLFVDIDRMLIVRELTSLDFGSGQHTGYGLVAGETSFYAAVRPSWDQVVIAEWNAQGDFLGSHALPSLNSVATEMEMAAYSFPYIYFAHLDISRPGGGSAWRPGRVDVRTWEVDYSYSFNQHWAGDMEYGVGFNLDSEGRLYLQGRVGEQPVYTRLGSSGAEDAAFRHDYYRESPMRLHVAEWKEAAPMLLADGEDDATEVFVYSMTRMGQVGAWSRYLFPFTLDDWAIAGDILHLRSGDFIHRVDSSVVGDEIGFGDDGWQFEIVPFEGMIQWPWLEFGQPGVTKMLYGFDIVGEGAVSVSFGIDQSNGGLFTPGYQVPADTVPGMVIPMPLSAPSLSVKLTYDGSESWQWNALGLYLQDLRGMS